MEKIINDAWENRAKIDGNSDKSILDAITTTIEKVDKEKSELRKKKVMSGLCINGLKKQFY
jgi:hypothetical protein